MPANLIEKIAKLVTKLTEDRKYDGYGYHSNVAVCTCGHVTTCSTCSSNDRRWSYERSSEIGR